MRLWCVLYTPNHGAGRESNSLPLQLMAIPTGVISWISSLGERCIPLLGRLQTAEHSALSSLHLHGSQNRQEMPVRHRRRPGTFRRNNHPLLRSPLKRRRLPSGFVHSLLLLGTLHCRADYHGAYIVRKLWWPLSDFLVVLSVRQRGRTHQKDRRLLHLLHRLLRW